jgi:hypothetical protein
MDDERWTPSPIKPSAFDAVEPPMELSEKAPWEV